ncbi:MAG: DsrE family protein [Bacteroidota bacterium]
MKDEKWELISTSNEVKFRRDVNANKMMRVSIIYLLFFVSYTSNGQNRVNPVIKNYGGIYEIPDATVVADREMEYKIVVDVVTGAENSDEVAWGLNNVARMLNLHAVSGADMDRITVVLAIHGSATYAVMDNSFFKKRFDVDNPNLPLIRELKEAGVKLTVCGQSLISRDVPVKSVTEEVEIAKSMLTTVTTHQLKGYALLIF